MRRTLLPLLFVTIPQLSEAQCGFNYAFYQTGNCYLVGFDIGLNVSGGTGPYTITWFAQGFPIGTGPVIPVAWTGNSPNITVEVTDALGCTENGAEYWIDPGNPIWADVTVQPDPLDCSNNTVTFNNVTGIGACQGLMIIDNDGFEEIGIYTAEPIVLTGVPGSMSLMLVPLSQTCGLCPSVMLVDVPNLCGSNSIAGRVYVDGDNSCSYTAGEIEVPGSFVLAAGVESQLVGSNSSGNYLAHLDAGAYTVSIPNLGSGWEVSCPLGGSYTETVPPNAAGRDFGLSPVSVLNDLEVTMIGTGLSRAGWNTQVVVTCRNKGNTPLSGTLDLTFDASLNFVSAAPAAASQAGNLITWDVPLLQPFGTASFTATLFVPIPTPIGTVLTHSASLTASATDDAPEDNTASMQRTITASFDPNDKQVLPGGDIAISQVQAGQKLDYIVRFQNTGNDVAFDVRIEDEIDPLLDLNTFEIVAASHPWTAQITERSLVFRFDTINLPDSGSNFAGSQGYIRYRIAPIQGIAANDVITNEANIFFDFNLPITTNAVSTTITDINTGLASVDPGFVMVLRDGDVAMLRSSLPMRSVEILDVTGRSIGTIPLNAEREVRMPLNTYSGAIYLLRVRMDQGSTVVRMLR